MSFLRNLAHIGLGTATKWLDAREQQKAEVAAKQVDSNVFSVRNEVARKTHEGLARSVWRYRGEDIPGSIELLVCDVEAQTLEDGEYILVVHLMPRNVDFEDENFDPKEIEPLPLYAFLENFVPTGTINSGDYNA